MASSALGLSRERLCKWQSNGLPWLVVRLVHSTTQAKGDNELRIPPPQPCCHGISCSLQRGSTMCRAPGRRRSNKSDFLKAGPALSAEVALEGLLGWGWTWQGAEAAFPFKRFYLYIPMPPRSCLAICSIWHRPCLFLGCPWSKKRFLSCKQPFARRRESFSEAVLIRPTNN